MIFTRALRIKKMYADLHPRPSAPRAGTTDAIEQGLIQLKDAKRFVDHVGKVIRRAEKVKEDSGWKIDSIIPPPLPVTYNHYHYGGPTTKVVIQNGEEKKEKKKKEESLSQLQIAGIFSTVALTIPSVIYFIRDDLGRSALIGRTQAQCRELIDKFRNSDLEHTERVKILQQLCYAWDAYHPIVSKKTQEEYQVKTTCGAGLGLSVIGAIAANGWIFGGGALVVGSAAVYWLYRSIYEDVEKEEGIKKEIETRLDQADAFFTQ